MVSFVTQRRLDPGAVAVLAKHCCVFTILEKHSEIVFPQGTVKNELWPRVSGDIYELILPDGYKCEAHYTRRFNQYIIFCQPENRQSST